MSFREALGRHLLAMETRDLDTLAATLADPLLLIMADGTLKRSKADFLEAHRGWFDYREDGRRSASYAASEELRP